MVNIFDYLSDEVKNEIVNKIDPDEIEQNGNTVLYNLCMLDNNNIFMIKKLIEKSKNIDTISPIHKDTVLHRVCYILKYRFSQTSEQYYYDIMEMLLKKGANPNHLACNETPIMSILSSKSTKCLSLLIKYGGRYDKHDTPNGITYINTMADVFDEENKDLRKQLEDLTQQINDNPLKNQLEILTKEYNVLKIKFDNLKAIIG
jgi:hypothetical protein